MGSTKSRILPGDEIIEAIFCKLYKSSTQNNLFMVNSIHLTRVNLVFIHQIRVLLY